MFRLSQFERKGVPNGWRCDAKRALRCHRLSSWYLKGHPITGSQRSTWQIVMNRSHRYGGADLRRQLNVSTAILKMIRCSIGSQCRSLNQDNYFILGKNALEIKSLSCLTLKINLRVRI